MIMKVIDKLFVGLSLLLVVLCGINARKVHNNVLLILADDLGYGDTSMPPFVGLKVKTPNLEKMAQRGTILTNYHTAAATCSPTRASILTGMYPWRMGLKAVYEYGQKGNSNRDDWLPPIPTIPMVLSEANYSVSHSGKWHLGGMRLDDLNMRTLPVKEPNEPGGKRCQHPGPNQQGFQNYVSVLDGPGSPRQNHLQLHSQLYSQGCNHLLENDIRITPQTYNISGYLTKCEADHAMRAMNRSIAANQPFYIQVWFHCPHGPIEEIPGWRHLLGKRNPRMALDLSDKYITMIADMDVQIGRLLQNIDALGIADETLVVFTSDNGPEDFAGTTAGFRGKKRHLYEGGIRVPALVQWTGTVPAGQVSDAFVVSTDLFPTFLDAAGVRIPQQVRLDGLSVLPQLIPDYYTLFPTKNTTATSATTTTPIVAATRAEGSTSAYADPSTLSGRSLSATSKIPHKHTFPRAAAHIKTATSDPIFTPGFTTKPRYGPDEIREDPELYRMAIRDRVTLWHNDYEGPRRTAAWVYDFKIILNEQEVMSEMYDMHTDKYEKQNLLANFNTSYWSKFQFSTTAGHHVVTFMPTPTVHHTKITLDTILNERLNEDVHIWIASHMYRVLKDYAKYGNSAYQALLAAHPGWMYSPTVESDYRVVGRRDKTNHVSPHQLININTCSPPPSTTTKPTTTATSICSCDIKNITTITPWPFARMGEEAIRYINPGRVLDAVKLLKLRHKTTSSSSDAV